VKQCCLIRIEEQNPCHGADGMSACEEVEEAKWMTWRLVLVQLQFAMVDDSQGLAFLI